MKTPQKKRISDSGEGAFKKSSRNTRFPGKTAKRLSETNVYSKKELFKMLDDFFTKPNYLDDYLA